MLFDHLPVRSSPTRGTMSAAARLLTAAAFTLMGAAQAMAVGAGFSVHWMVTTDDRELRFGSGNDWSARMNFGSAQIQRDTLVLYEHWFASDVRTTGLSLTKESDYYERYERSLRTMLDQRVPQGFDGYVCLDIEFLPTYYGQRTGGPNLYPTTGYSPRYFDDWYDYVRSHRPELLADRSTEDAEKALAESYEDAVREWRVWTITKCKQLRPGTKFAFYGIPGGSRHNNYNLPDPNTFKQRNDEKAWYITASDAVFIPLYQNRFTVPPGITPEGWGQMTVAQGRDWIESNVREAKRIAQGKPVFVLAFSKYMENVEGRAGEFLDQYARENMFRVPKAAGADGLVIWDHLASQNDFNSLQDYLNQYVLPIVNDLVPAPPAPPPDGGGDAPPAGGGGSGGGGGDTGGSGGGTGGGSGGDSPPAGGGGGDAPPAGGGDSPPAGGGGSGGSPPAGGGDSPPAGGGGDSPPAGGGDAPPAGSGGGGTPPAGGGDSPPAGGGSGDTPPVGGSPHPRGPGGGGSPNGGGGGSPPAGGGDSPPAGGGGGSPPPTGGGDGGGASGGAPNGGSPPAGGGGDAPPAGGGSGDSGGQGSGGSGSGGSSGSGSGGGGAGGSGGDGGGAGPANPTTVNPRLNTSGARRLGIGKAPRGLSDRSPIRVIGQSTPLMRRGLTVQVTSTPKSTKNRMTKVVVPLKSSMRDDSQTANAPEQ